jgi:hypothetical protein
MVRPSISSILKYIKKFNIEDLEYLESVNGEEITKSSLNRSNIFSSKIGCSKYRWRAGIPLENFRYRNY